jgi:hypothetical protein
MKFAIVLICILSVFLTGCSGAKKEAFAKGCEVGINAVVEDMGQRPNKEYIAKFCAEQAEEAQAQK